MRLDRHRLTHHEVELPEDLQFAQTGQRFAVGLRRLFEMTDGPIASADVRESTHEENDATRRSGR